VSHAGFLLDDIYLSGVKKLIPKPLRLIYTSASNKEKHSQMLKAMFCVSFDDFCFRRPLWQHQSGLLANKVYGLETAGGLQVVESACGIPAMLMGTKLEVSKDMDTETRLAPLGVGAAICPFNLCVYESRLSCVVLII
jgi:hypothetical protein